MKQNELFLEVTFLLVLQIHIQSPESVLLSALFCDTEFRMWTVTVTLTTFILSSCTTLSRTGWRPASARVDHATLALKYDHIVFNSFKQIGVLTVFLCKRTVQVMNRPHWLSTSCYCRCPTGLIDHAQPHIHTCRNRHTRTHPNYLDESQTEK